MKIEGRLKPAEYVASVTRHYRTVLDAACGPLSLWERARVRAAENSQSPHPRPLAQRERGDDAVSQSERGESLSPEDIAEMEATFSRGFCHGWLDGSDHRGVVSGEGSAKRGVLLGEVRGVRGQRILVELAGPLRRGDGVVFEGDRSQAAEQGGRVYEIFQNRRSIETEVAAGTVELTFRYGSIDLSQIRLGQKVWKTDDPRAARRLRQSYSSGRSQRRVPLDLQVEASVGSPLRVVAVATNGATCRVESPQPLPEAMKHPLTTETLTEQFGRLGKTPYQLRRLEAKLDGQAMIPLSELGKLRHEMVRQLDAAAAQPPRRAMFNGSALAALRTTAQEDGETGRGGDGETRRQGDKEKDVTTSVSQSPCLALSPSSSLHVLCRSMEQLEAALDCGVTSVIADFRKLQQYGNAVRAAHLGGASILLAAPRIHKPGESAVFDELAEKKPDGLLVRNLAGLAFCRRKGLPAVADFSLNAANDLSVEWLHSQGARRVTAAYDLNRQRLLDLAAAVPAEWLDVVVHRHTPMFHSEYCLFCGVLSSGKNRADCGRPCDRHEVRLRDRLGVEHRLSADSQCRNTLFHAEAESLLEIVPSLQQRGVRHFRVELLDESSTEEVGRVLTAYRRSCTQS